MYIKCMDTYITTRVLTFCCFACSGEEGVMEDVKRDKCVHIKWTNTCIKTRVLTTCCCAGSSEEGVMEDVKRNKCVRKVDGHMYKNEYLQSVVA